MIVRRARLTHPRRVNRQLGVVFTVVFVDLLGFGIVLPLLPTYAAMFRVTPAAIGSWSRASPCSSSSPSRCGAPLSDRYGRRPVIIVGLIGSAASYVLFAAGRQLLGAARLSRIVAGAMGATIGVAQAYIADVTPPERRAHAMGAPRRRVRDGLHPRTGAGRRSLDTQLQQCRRRRRGAVRRQRPGRAGLAPRDAPAPRAPAVTRRVPLAAWPRRWPRASS